MELFPDHQHGIYPSDSKNTLASKYPLRILVIEGHLINQFILASTLINFGYDITKLESATIAEGLPEQPFNLIFIDLQVLESENGALEKFIQQKRPPTIAISTLKRHDGYHRYVKMGFDDYLSFPIPTQQLQMVLRHWHFRGQSANKVLPLEQFNTAEFLCRVGYNVATSQEMIELFAEDGKRLLQQIHSALSKEDFYQLKKATHELKGICLALSASKLKQLTVEVEKTAKDKAFSKACSLFEQLEQECHCIQQALNDFQNALLG